ncbi:MAG: 5-bromo-4-chloroindolyl phosphate hydrolysis family protein [Lachnospiraceae bacterium]|nr:5-bromo-4-chloroindolyl phosphate hydrolysis family protein [Lachnospiraceae bacterium]
MSDLQELGKELEQTISNAVQYGDFSTLSRDIRILASKAADSAKSGVKKAAGFQEKPEKEKYVDSTAYEYDSPAGTMRDIKGRNLKKEDITEDPGWENTKTAKYINRINRDHRMERRQERKASREKTPVLYEKTAMKKVISIFSIAGGYSMGLLFFTIFLILSLNNPLALIGMIIPGALFGMGIWGTAGIKKLTRFDRYLKTLAGKTYADIKNLAQATGLTEKAVVKDLKRMISGGLFLQGHIDEEQTCLITSDATYEQYLTTKKSLAEKTAMKEKEEEGLSESQKEIFRAGEDYLDQIQRCNDEIPGEEISAKIDRMKHSVEMILSRARKQPALTEDLRRLMNYYLPTTVKLLNAYADLDRQGKTSENIDKSKREIEETIDTLNDAFDRLFDDMFEDTSLDISTDAEVMKTLLKQEGLTGRNFTSKDTI